VIRNPGAENDVTPRRSAAMVSAAAPVGYLAQASPPQCSVGRQARRRSFPTSTPRTRAAASAADRALRRARTAAERRRHVPREREAGQRASCTGPQRSRRPSARRWGHSRATADLKVRARPLWPGGLVGGRDPALAPLGAPGRSGTVHQARAGAWRSGSRREGSDC
jgi:hypothetical protein